MRASMTAFTAADMAEADMVAAIADRVAPPRHLQADDARLRLQLFLEAGKKLPPDAERRGRAGRVWHAELRGTSAFASFASSVIALHFSIPP